MKYEILKKCTCNMQIMKIFSFTLIYIQLSWIGYSQNILRDKTIVAWVSPDNLEQHGGSALTIDDGHGNFDAIVFGEIEPARWMAGSNNFSRTEKDQSAYPVETAGSEDLVQIAIVYEGREISILRDGSLYTTYKTASVHEFNLNDCIVLFGKRHLEAGDPGNSFTGKIIDARIYIEALSSAQVSGLKPGIVSDGPRPWAWWDFANNGLQDVTRKFAHINLAGDAYYEKGSLVLNGNGASLIASRNPVEFDWNAKQPVPGKIIKNSRFFRERLLKDPYRPVYHFCIPEGNGMPGDPNGAFWHKGRYHLMYLYNREESGFCWGHISSSDLLHWRHHPDAIGPGNGDEGCFSGGAFVDDDCSAYLTYWMLWGDKGIGMAKNKDPEFNEWEKFENNPVIKSTEWGITQFKDNSGKDIYIGSADPSNIWKKDGKYFMLTGNLLVLNKIGRNSDSPENEKGDRLYLFSSEDLSHWKYMHRFYESDRKWTEPGEDNMCPSFLPLPSSSDGGPASDKHLLLFISHNLGCQYYIGDYREERFFPEKHGRMTWVDNSYFAPEALIDGQGRQIMWSWIFDDRPGDLKAESGWTGIYGLPRSLWLNPDGELGISPVKELQRLRMYEKSLSGLEIKDGNQIILDSLGTGLMEMDLVVETSDIKSFVIDVCVSVDGREKTSIIYNSVNNKLEIDTSESSIEYGKKVVESAPFQLKKGENLELKIFIDRSIVEVFANERQAIARSIYPTLGGNGIRITATGGNGKIISLKRWEMEPSNPF